MGATLTRTSDFGGWRNEPNLQHRRLRNKGNKKGLFSVNLRQFSQLEETQLGTHPTEISSVEIIFEIMEWPSIPMLWWRWKKVMVSGQKQKLHSLSHYLVQIPAWEEDTAVCWGPRIGTGDMWAGSCPPPASLGFLFNILDGSALGSAPMFVLVYHLPTCLIMSLFL